MTIEGIHDAPLSKVPDFDCLVIRGGDKAGSCAIESDGIDTVVMGIIVLKKPLRSAIKDFDFLVSAARCQAGAIWVELYLINHACVVGVAMNKSTSVGNIPQSYSSVITTRGHHSGVIGELRGFYPICMTMEGLQKFHVLNGPKFNKLIIRRRNQLLSVSIELNRLYRSRMAFEHLAVC